MNKCKKFLPKHDGFEIKDLFLHYECSNTGNTIYGRIQGVL